MGPIRYSFTSLCAMFSLLLGTDLVAEKAAQIGRYTEADPVPLPTQIDLLSAVVFVALDDTVITVGDAVEDVLEGSGYQLSVLPDHTRERQLLFGFALPKVHRTLGPITIRGALKTLAGEGWMLIEDPAHRLVTFRLCDRYLQGKGREE